MSNLTDIHISFPTDIETITVMLKITIMSVKNHIQW